MPKENVFKWVDEPPPEPPRRGQIDTLIVPLDEKPGHWARLTGPYRHSSYARNMVGGWSEKLPKYEFVARPGLDGDEQFYVYARKRARGGRRAKK